MIWIIPLFLLIATEQVVGWPILFTVLVGWWLGNRRQGTMQVLGMVWWGTWFSVFYSLPWWIGMSMVWWSWLVLGSERVKLNSSFIRVGLVWFPLGLFFVLFKQVNVTWWFVLYHLLAVVGVGMSLLFAQGWKKYQPGHQWSARFKLLQELQQ